MTHRFYDPGAGRFLTRDPAGYAGGVNLYAYCGNDPVNFADPSGLSLMPIEGGGQTLAECMDAAKKAYDREMAECNRFAGDKKTVRQLRACQGLALLHWSEAITECEEHETQKQFDNLCKGLGDVLHNRVPGGSGQPIFGNPFPTKPIFPPVFGPGNPIWDW